MMDYQKLYSSKVSSMKPSGIRKFFDIVSEMKDAISLGVGEPDFPTPWEAKRSAISSIERGETYYTSNLGLLSLREKIAGFAKKKYNLEYKPKNEILVTVGASEGIDNALRAYIDEGDEVIIPEPCFVCYSAMAALAGAKVINIPTKAEDGFLLTPKQLKAAITPKTKILLIGYPNNPTGAVISKEQMEALAEIIRETDIIVISDEIYSELSYFDKHISFASIDGMKERTIVVNGFSKTFAMTGWRLGYLLGKENLIDPICKIHQYAIMSAPTMSQYAALKALDDYEPIIDSMRDEYDIRRRYLVSELNDMGLTVFEPRGAFYIFPSIKNTGLSSEEFCERLLLEQKVAVVPGNAFGDCGEGFIRISYSYSMTHIMEAMRRMRIFLNQFK